MLHEYVRGDHWLLDGQVARQAIVTRQEAEQGGRGMLDEFLHLCDAEDEAILKYARTWGVLELCRHNLPSCHEFSLGDRLRLPAPLSAKPQTGRTGPADDPRQCPPLGREPLATWRFFSGQAKALLNIAADLHRIGLGEREDWAKLLREGVTPVQSLGAQRLCVRDVIEDWLKLGRIKPAIDDLTGGLTWTGADLFGELAVQIALAAEARDGQAFCIVCGKAYEPKAPRDTTRVQLLSGHQMPEGSRCSEGTTISESEAPVGARKRSETTISRPISRENQRSSLFTIGNVAQGAAMPHRD